MKIIRCQDKPEPYLQVYLTTSPKEVIVGKAYFIQTKIGKLTWSSAAAHCKGHADEVLTAKAYWRKQFESIGNWSAWLAEVDPVDELSIIRRNIDKGLPCGSDRFIRKLEKQIGRALEYRPPGRPVKKEND